MHEEIHQNYQATCAAKNDPFKKNGVLFHDTFPEQFIQVLSIETVQVARREKPAPNTLDMCMSEIWHRKTAGGVSRSLLLCSTLHLIYLIDLVAHFLISWKVFFHCLDLLTCDFLEHTFSRTSMPPKIGIINWSDPIWWIISKTKNASKSSKC